HASVRPAPAIKALRNTEIDKRVLLTISAWVATMLPHTQNRRATYLRSFDAAINICVSLAVGR
ncbi:hypothetical protein ABFV62_32105, partial [Pseudomonas syringae]|uniref:hypothetical protein n=1 Tax=Pseudomonas syringae TaxID=317 RepID=UPI0034D5AB30